MATNTRNPRQLFGSDLALHFGGTGADLALQGPVGGAGDLALAVGNDNVVQALSMRLSVRKGELALLGWPDYGSRLHELIGEPDLPRTRLKAQVFARAAVEADPRVLKVDAVDVVRIAGERSVLRLSMAVRLIAEQQPANRVFDLVFDLALDGSTAASAVVATTAAGNATEAR